MTECCYQLILNRSIYFLLIGAPNFIAHLGLRGLMPLVIPALRSGDYVVFICTYYIVGKKSTKKL